MGDLKFGWWLPPNLGAENAHGIDDLISYLHVLMIALFIGWAAFIAYTLWRFRARPGHAATYELPKAKASKGVEVAVVAAELVLLFGFSMPVWAKVKDAIPPEKDALVIRCVAEQFAWNFQYAGKDGKFGRSNPKLMASDNPLGLDRTDPDAKDDVVTTNNLYIPVKKDIIVKGTSKDVIHSFWIPTLRTKADVIPGMSVPIWFKAQHTSAEARKALTRTYSLDANNIPDTAKTLFPLMAMEDVKGAGDTLALKAGQRFVGGEDLIKQLVAAGVKQVVAAPADPLEISCAQLCGNSHYRMRGMVTVETQEEFDKWLEQQAASASEEEE